jgi:hypothetical protein
MERKLESYVAVDAEGNEHQISVFREESEIIFAGVKQRVYSRVFHRMENGNPVNVHSDPVVSG